MEQARRRFRPCLEVQQVLRDGGWAGWCPRLRLGLGVTGFFPEQGITGRPEMLRDGIHPVERKGLPLLLQVHAAPGPLLAGELGQLPNVDVLEGHPVLDVPVKAGLR